MKKTISSIFGTKSQTLKRLQPLVSKATILDQVSFTVKGWRDNRESVMASINDAFTKGYLIVRSSALGEDSCTESQAGKFRSELGIPAGDQSAICEAIESVIASYEENNSASGSNEVFVQPFIEDVTVSVRFVVSS